MKTVGYSVFLIETGEIVSRATYSHGDEGPGYQLDGLRSAWPEETHGIVTPDADPARHYVGTLGGEAVILDRPAMPAQTDKATVAADGVDELTLTGLPDPCEIVIDEPDPNVETTTVTVTGGGFVFTADDPGVYTVQVTRFPFLPFTVQVTAT